MVFYYLVYISIFYPRGNDNIKNRTYNISYLLILLKGFYAYAISARY